MPHVNFSRPMLNRLTLKHIQDIAAQLQIQDSDDKTALVDEITNKLSPPPLTSQGEDINGDKIALLELELAFYKAQSQGDDAKVLDALTSIDQLLAGIAGASGKTEENGSNGGQGFSDDCFKNFEATRNDFVPESRPFDSAWTAEAQK